MEQALKQGRSHGRLFAPLPRITLPEPVKRTLARLENPWWWALRPEALIVLTALMLTPGSQVIHDFQPGVTQVLWTMGATRIILDTSWRPGQPFDCRTSYICDFLERP